MPRDPDCVFCKIVSVQIPAAVVYENTAIIAFLDVNPLADGHLLVVPKDHYAHLVDVPPVVCGELFSPIPTLGRALMDVTGAEGFNELVNEGRAAGQVVPHVHCHLIPRRPVDELGYRWNVGKCTPERQEELAAAYQKALPEQR